MDRSAGAQPSLGTLWVEPAGAFAPLPPAAPLEPPPLAPPLPAGAGALLLPAVVVVEPGLSLRYAKTPTPPRQSTSTTTPATMPMIRPVLDFCGGGGGGGVPKPGGPYPGGAEFGSP
ncbi:hypothetical protein [Fodinicola feengrottensis]|uniref:hypothetical protein n=1 Tax=Fodinicola feengrottensis TaxID=435914 RepID=UPI0013D866BF|nr:hypothetical protein [Fodinicola feengrottensis]